MSTSQKIHDAWRKAMNPELPHSEALEGMSGELEELNEHPKNILLASVMKGVRRELAALNYAAKVRATEECISDKKFPAAVLEINRCGRDVISPQFSVEMKSNHPLAIKIRLGNDLESFSFQKDGDNDINTIRLARTIMFAHASACQFASYINDQEPS